MPYTARLVFVSWCLDWLIDDVCSLHVYTLNTTKLQLQTVNKQYMHCFNIFNNVTMYSYTVIGGVIIFQYAVYIYWSVICLQKYFTFSHVYLVRVIYVKIVDYNIRLYAIVIPYIHFLFYSKATVPSTPSWCHIQVRTPMPFQTPNMLPQTQTLHSSTGHVVFLCLIQSTISARFDW